jgi:mitochondrial fission protein ELM1
VGPLGSILMSTSRRTGAGAAQALSDAIGDGGFKYLWGQTGENPYVGMLALADAVVVTGDSVSMCSEACATDKPVYVYAPGDMAAPKHRRLHEELYRLGLARPFADRVDTWTHPPLNAANDIAAAILLKSV